MIIIKILWVPPHAKRLGVPSKSKFSFNNILYKFACITETRVLEIRDEYNSLSALENQYSITVDGVIRVELQCPKRIYQNI